MAAETTGFEINGTVYPVPTVDTFTMDEAQVLYDYSGLTIEDFLDEEDDETRDRSKNPGFTKALLHVAYQRGNPTLTRKAVEKVAGSVNSFDALEQLLRDTVEKLKAEAGDGEIPPAQTSEPDESSPSGSLENKNSSSPNTETPGNDSPTGSDEPGSQPLATGVSRSVTPPTSDRATSAA